MRFRKTRRYRHRPNGIRGRQLSNNGGEQSMLGTSLVNGRSRNNFNSQQSPEKLVERYNLLAKEALSSGDRILSENYNQHADHFVRIIEYKNLNQNQNKPQVNEEKKVLDKDKATDNLHDQNQDIKEK